MKNIFYFTILFLGFSLASCEHIIDFDGEIKSPKITINAIAVPDTIFTAVILKEVFFTDATPERKNESLYKQYVLDNAQALITVNGETTYRMNYNSENFNYESLYIPKSGDKILINVNAPDFESVTTRAVVPTKNELQIIRSEVLYDKNYFELDDWSDMAATDTIMRITAKITNVANEISYYRLIVRSISTVINANNNSVSGYEISDIFTSADIIFKDARLTKRYKGWPIGFSNIFDNHLFKGKEYEFTVESRKRWGKDQKVVIELQSISLDLYNYLKSTMIYRITEQDSYTESIQIYSNVTGGYGILGALNGQKQTLYFY